MACSEFVLLRALPKIEALASPGLHQNAPGLFHLPGKQAIAKNLGLVERLDFVRDCMKWGSRALKHQCPLWVISGHMRRQKSCPLFPDVPRGVRHVC